jgi:hypothetical protein
MAEGTAEVAPEGEEGAGHFIGKIQKGKLLKTFDDHGKLQSRENVYKFPKISCRNGKYMV